jgi:hypothetical protein
VIAYIDTSVLLRIVLREPGALADLRSYDGLVSSELIAVESTRTIDRLRVQGSPNRCRRRSARWTPSISRPLIWRDRVRPLPAMATHDMLLGTAALAFGFDVRGI